MKDITIGTVEDASLTTRIATVETAMTTSGLVAIASARQLRHARRHARVRRQCQVAAHDEAEPGKLGQLQVPNQFDRRDFAVTHGA
jgi:hypothetical protein